MAGSRAGVDQEEVGGMSGMDVLRKRIARALWEHRYPGVEQTGPLADLALTDADAVITALRLVEDWDEDCWDGGSIPIRRWATPWERIEEDG